MQDFNFELPATRGIQAGRPYIQLSIPMKILKRVTAFDDGDVLSRSQREVELPRAKKIAQYIEAAHNADSFYVIPTLTGTVNKIDFEEAGGLPNVGKAIIPMDATIHLFDGQHRASGIIQVVEACENLSDTVSILLYPELTLAERQQAFADINSNTKKPTGAITTVYDHRDPLSQLAVTLAREVDFFSDLTDYEKNNVTGGSGYCFSIKAIKDATKMMIDKKLLMDGVSDCSHKSNKLTEQIVINGVKALWEAWNEPLGFGMLSDLGAQEHRERYITTQTVMLNVVGMTTAVVLKHVEGNVEKACELIRNMGENEERLVKSYWYDRIINRADGHTKANKRDKNLAVNLWLTAMGIPLPKDNQVAEDKLAGIESQEEAQPQETASAPFTMAEQGTDTNEQAETSPSAGEAFPFGFTKNEYDAYLLKVGRIVDELGITDAASLSDYLEKNLTDVQATKLSSIRKLSKEYKAEQAA
ncbi:DGQHR domain-containing protein [Vibrio sp. SCSIO 43137]|uniref:DGQHR domain-containing protein n=1 Tax=Vibrio sp. SCSIO 43137 TaxID=3021011 RepID=UPI0023073CA9|nr:DGQHR domain-containing protein [Vibrio sp. SCSIO 43137]WCE28405.1 DGQHR domain-containing protein [Vibrio sp. SCSIO 43137]